MLPPVSQEAIEMSQEFFTNPANYGPFTLTGDHKIIIDCIEPSEKQGVAHGSHDTAVQTGGGGAGMALDAANSRIVLTGEFVTVEDGLDHDQLTRRGVVLNAHHACAFLGAIAEIAGEMARPSDETKERFTNWAHYFNHEDVLYGAARKISAAAAQQEEYILSKDHMQHLLDHVDEQHPELENVSEVRGVAAATRLYVVNLDPTVGQNRNNKPADPEAARKVSAYHDSVGATLAKLDTAYDMPGDERKLRVASALKRAAATHTVIGRDKPEMITYEVKPSNSTSSGLLIAELAA
jgi:hypothetical protein